MNKLLKLATIFSLAICTTCAKSNDSGAGFVFVCLEDKTILLAKRSKFVDHPGVWAGFGGGIEPGETPMEAAIREVTEEAGSFPEIKQILTSTTRKENNFEYTTFIADISLEEKKQWRLVLNKEMDNAKWFSKLPEDLHPGLRWTLAQLMLENR